MYSPPAFCEERIDVLRAAIRSHPLGTLITGGPSGLIANVVPFSLEAGSDSDVLRAHLAKANGQILDLRKQTPVLVIFQGPQAYVSPSWYPSKQEHGKVVPTWNYVLVQVSGTPTIIDDDAWLREHLTRLTAEHEQMRDQPWSIDDAPADFIAGQMKGIVGLEIPIERVEGKWKASQNQPVPNRHGVAEGLRGDGHMGLAVEVADRAGGR